MTCVKDVVIIPTIAMMSAGFSMESSLFLDEDAMCLGHDVWLIGNQGLRDQRLKLGKLLLLIDITKLHFLKMDL